MAESPFATINCMLSEASSPVDDLRIIATAYSISTGWMKLR